MITLEQMRSYLALLMEWGVPEEKAKKFILRYSLGLTNEEVRDLFSPFLEAAAGKFQSPLEDCQEE